MKKGSVVLMPFPFTNLNGSKIRLGSTRYFYSTCFKMQSETARTLKNTAGRVETPKNRQDLRSRIRTGRFVTFMSAERTRTLNRILKMKTLNSSSSRNGSSEPCKKTRK